MADNFNLRTFLSENKLTKNAQLLKEQESQHTPEEELYYKIVEQLDIAGLTGEVTVALHSTHGMPKPEFQVMNADDAAWMIAEAVVEAEADVDDILFAQGDEIDQQGELDPETEGLECGLEIAIVDVGTYEIYQGSNKGGEDNLDEGKFSDSYDTPAAKKVHGQLRDIVDIFEKSYAQETQELNAAIDAAEQETGSQVTPTERRVLQQQASWIRTHDSEMEREGTENKKPIMKETKLTAKERCLVEMVQAAMGYPEEGEDEFNPADAEDQKDYRRDQYRGNQMEEGDEMVQEKPLPKYSSIEELMKEIEHGTNEAACKYKMEEMKRVYQALEAKVGSLEEGEHAEHIDQKAVKQMRKDIAALRKAEEKLRKEFEKKFNKKEKSAAAPKEQKVEALQEGTFDLRKFLVENKLTAGSRMLNEGIIDLSDAAVNLLMDKTKYATKPGSDKGVYVVYDLSKPKGKGSFGDDDDSTQKVGYWWTKDSAYKANKFESDDQETINKLK